MSGSAACSAIVFAVAAVVSQVRLSQACGGRFDEALGFLLVGVLFFPILIVWFFAFYYDARTSLRLAGVRCGLLGIRRRDLLRLYEGFCPACGYDLSELLGAAVCPECGNPHESSTSRDKHAPVSPV